MSALEQRSDAELIAAVRSGDRAAYGPLWSRHEAAARAFALSIGRPSDAEEMVSEAFTRVLATIVDGAGPDAAFRPYLLSAIRRISIDLGRRYYQRVTMTDQADDFRFTPERSAQEHAEARADNTTALRAWRSLPEASQAVLWHLVVEKESLADIAPMLGTSPNGVATRATRAKERLRQAFLQEHIREPDDPECTGPRSKLGAYTRGALSRRDTDLVAAHLAECAACTAAKFDVADINQLLNRSVAPALIGGPVVLGGYLTAKRQATHAAEHQPTTGDDAAAQPRPRAAEPGGTRSGFRPRGAVLLIALVIGAAGTGVGAYTASQSRADHPSRSGVSGSPITRPGPSSPAGSSTPASASTKAAPSTPPAGSESGRPPVGPASTGQSSTAAPISPAATGSATPGGPSHSSAITVAPPPVRKTIQLRLGRSTSAGSVTFALSPGWTMTALDTSDAAVRCTLSATRASCPIPAAGSGNYRFTATLQAPDAHSGGTLTMTFLSGPVTLSHGYPL